RLGMKLYDRLIGRDLRIPPLAHDGAAVVTGRGLTVTYDGVPALDRVDAEVKAGQVLAVIGPNGAGKSTLLAALAGDTTLTAGTVEIDGAAPSTWTPEEL